MVLWKFRKYQIEIDQRWKKDNCRISDTKTQKLEDFFCQSYNAKDKFATLKETNLRWNAKAKRKSLFILRRNEIYTKELGCKGCYQYDPVAYRKQCFKD